MTHGPSPYDNAFTLLHAERRYGSDAGAGELEAAAFDLSDLTQVRAFAEEFVGRHERLDFLSTNAGMGPLLGGEAFGFSLGWTGPWTSAQEYEMPTT